MDVNIKRAQREIAKHFRQPASLARKTHQAIESEAARTTMEGRKCKAPEMVGSMDCNRIIRKKASPRKTREIINRPHFQIGVNPLWGSRLRRTCSEIAAVRTAIKG
jgi:hypothetical protein